MNLTIVCTGYGFPLFKLQYHSARSQEGLMEGGGRASRLNIMQLGKRGSFHYRDAA